MPLLDILGVDDLNQGFTVGICLLDQETKEDFNWAITHIRSLFHLGIWPSVIVTDCEEALIQTVDSIFPSARTKLVLCRRGFGSATVPAPLARTIDRHRHCQSTSC